MLSAPNRDDLLSFSLSLVPSLVSDMRACLVVLDYIFRTFIQGSKIRVLSLDLEISSDPLFVRCCRAFFFFMWLVSVLFINWRIS